jgi:hypothetical protein
MRRCNAAFTRGFAPTSGHTARAAHAARAVRSNGPQRPT